MAEQMTGAEMVIQALIDQGVEHIFGYPGGAALPIYDAMFQQDKVQHILVRHEQGATHMAEGYARSTGKVGVVLVTSGPGATNAVTGLTDALMDSIPLVCITAQVPTTLIGSDAFQECDTVGITRSLHQAQLPGEERRRPAARHARGVPTSPNSGRPGPVLVDIPKDVQFALGTITSPTRSRRMRHKSYHPQMDGDAAAIEAAVDLMLKAERPIFYTGGGVINAGPEATEQLRELAELTGFPVTSTLMGLGAFPASNPQWMGMLGMHGTYEANMAMHDCDLMINIGARFDDRITGRIDAFSPDSTQDPCRYRSALDQQERARRRCRSSAIASWCWRRWCASGGSKTNAAAHRGDRAVVEADRGAGGRENSLGFKNSDTTIKPQHAIQRLYEATKERGRLHHHRSRPAPDVGGAALPFRQAEPLDDLGWARHDGLWPAGRGRRAGGASRCAGDRHCRRGQRADDDAGDVDGGAVPAADQDLHPQQRAHGHGPPVAGPAAWRRATRIPIRSRCPISSSWRRPMAARASGATTRPKLDAAIAEMLDYDGPVLFDCLVEKHENCLPMIPSGKPHNEMILPDFDDDIGDVIDDKGRQLV